MKSIIIKLPNGGFVLLDDSVSMERKSQMLNSGGSINDITSFSELTIG